MIWLWLPGVIWFALMVAAAGLYLSEPRARSPRPDYARIAELERELGISKNPRVVIDADGHGSVVDMPLPPPPDPNRWTPKPPPPGPPLSPPPRVIECPPPGMIPGSWQQRRWQGK